MAMGVGKRIGVWVSFVVLGALIAGVATAYVYRDDIRDMVVASTFDADERVTQIVNTITPTALGERTFLASQPTIGGREQFARWCAGVDHSEHGHVLGCFANRKIHLFEVTDERLDGIVEVTAAHELLHAAFARLSDTERGDLMQLLRAEYAARSETEPALAERMSVYEQLSDRAFANELHSVLGTEVPDLSPELTAHYDQYFTDRAAILDMYESYHSVFTELTARADELGAQLESLRDDIETRTAAYDEAVRQFNADAADFTARNERYEFSGKKQLFDAMRADLMSRQAALEGELAGLRADTDRFNALRDELIQLNAVSTELNDVLDSQLPAPTTRPDPSS